MDLHLYVHLIGENGKLDVILHKLDLLLNKEIKIMALEDDILAKVQEQTTIVTSVQTLVEALKAAVLANVPDPATRAKLQSVLDAITANDAALAVIANTTVPPTA